MTIEIRKGVPLPERCINNSGKGKWQKLFMSMDVGDSFVVSLEKKSMKPLYVAAKNSSVTIAVRKEGDHYAVWRTA